MSYFIKQAILEARKLYKQLANTVDLGKPPKTRVYDPINSDNQDNLITLSHQLTQKNIYLSKPSIANCVVDACIFNFENHANILISPDVNYCETRFLACKELLHLFMYSPEKSNHTATISDVKQLLLDILNHSQNTNQETPQSETDNAAYFGAIELLIPTQHVTALRNMRTRFVQDKIFPNKENLEIATLLGVPEFVVEFRLDLTSDEIFLE